MSAVCTQGDHLPGIVSSDGAIMSVSNDARPLCADAVRVAAGQETSAFDRIVFASQAMADLCAMARKAAATDLPVLIEGETGTGKELMARAIHMFSKRHQLLFMAENCGAIHDDLLQSELFGHRKGAFTGATTDRLGLFQAADGGTVFLDEISEISPSMQVSLLRFLQEGELRPLGSDKLRRSNVRIIAACNRPLLGLVAQGKFRQDLYYRLCGFELRMPPLRERPQDIPALAQHLLDKHATLMSRRIAGITPEAMACLSAHPFPGNVRELENEVRRMVALTDDGDHITLRHLPAAIAASAPTSRQTIAPNPHPLHPEIMPSPEGRTLKDKVEALEQQLVRQALIRWNWNHSRAAQELGLSRVGLANKVRRYRIERPHDMANQDGTSA
jgi:two-component system, NtrC family, response regulator HupR/HoxA